jgi:hypothetical protein
MLAVMKVDGFLQNLDQQYEEADVEGPQWGAFLERWHARFGERPVTVANLVDELERNASALYVDQTLRGCAPDEVLEAIAVKGRGNHRLGTLLRYRKDTRYPSGFVLVRAGSGHHAVRWSVQKASPAGVPGQATIGECVGGGPGESGGVWNHPSDL